MNKSFLRNKYKKVRVSIKNKEQLDDIILNKIINLEEYKKNMDLVFGEGACSDLRIRKYGGIEVV